MFERLTGRTGNGQIYLVEGLEEDMYGYYTGKGLKQIEKVIDRLAAYEDTGLTPEQIEAQQQEITNYLKVIEQQRDTLARDSDSFNKQQQEIESLKRELNAEISVNEALTADKDEQAGRIKQLEELLKACNQAFCWILHEADFEDECERTRILNGFQATRLAVSALLGGKEDV